MVQTASMSAAFPDATAAEKLSGLGESNEKLADRESALEKP
jgi:hypothetical protein